jgi:hypothetical protein
MRGECMEVDRSRDLLLTVARNSDTTPCEPFLGNRVLVAPRSFAWMIMSRNHHVNTFHNATATISPSITTPLTPYALLDRKSQSPN